MNPNILRGLLISAKKRGIVSKYFPKNSNKYYSQRSALLLDEFFFLALSKLDIGCLMECGAHEALASTKFSNMGKRAIAIEANPSTYKSKTLKAKSAGVEVLNIGLGASKGELKFYVPKNDSRAGSATFQPKSNEDYITKTVKVETIDNIFKQRNLNDSLIALWIDVEGFSREVLQGAKELLENRKCLMIKIEVETYPYFKGQALCTEINDYLMSFGFSPILVDDEYKQQFNVIFVKKQLIDILSLELKDMFDRMSTISFGVKELIWLKLTKLITRSVRLFKKN